MIVDLRCVALPALQYDTQYLFDNIVRLQSITLGSVGQGRHWSPRSIPDSTAVPQLPIPQQQRAQLLQGLQTPHLYLDHMSVHHFINPHYMTSPHNPFSTPHHNFGLNFDFIPDNESDFNYKYLPHPHLPQNASREGRHGSTSHNRRQGL